LLSSSVVVVIVVVIVVVAVIIVVVDVVMAPALIFLCHWEVISSQELSSSRDGVCLDA